MPALLAQRITFVPASEKPGSIASSPFCLPTPLYSRSFWRGIRPIQAGLQRVHSNRSEFDNLIRALFELGRNWGLFEPTSGRSRPDLGRIRPTLGHEVYSDICMSYVSLAPCPSTAWPLGSPPMPAPQGSFANLAQLVGPAESGLERPRFFTRPPVLLIGLCVCARAAHDGGLPPGGPVGIVAAIGVFVVVRRSSCVVRCRRQPRAPCRRAFVVVVV